MHFQHKNIPKALIYCETNKPNTNLNHYIQNISTAVSFGFLQVSFVIVGNLEGIEPFIQSTK